MDKNLEKNIKNKIGTKKGGDLIIDDDRLLYYILSRSNYSLSSICQHLNLTNLEFLYILNKSDINKRYERNVTPAMRLFASEYFSSLSAVDRTSILKQIDYKAYDSENRTVLCYMLDCLNRGKLSLEPEHWEFVFLNSVLGSDVLKIRKNIDFVGTTFYKTIDVIDKLRLSIETWEYFIKNTENMQDLAQKQKKYNMVNEANYSNFLNLKNTLREQRKLENNILKINDEDSKNKDYKI